MLSFRNSPMLPSLASPFTKSGQELYDSLQSVGGTWSEEHLGVFFLSDDDRGEQAADLLRAQMSLASGSQDELPLRAFVFISGDADFLTEYSGVTAPTATESCLYVRLPPTGATATDLTVSGRLGSEPRSYLASAVSDGVPSWFRSACPVLASGLSADDLQSLAMSGAFSWTGADLPAGLLGFLELANGELARISSLLSSLSGDSDTESATDAFLAVFRALLLTQAGQVIESTESGTLSFAQASATFLDDLAAEFAWFFENLPETVAGEAGLEEELLATLANSRVLKFAAAKQEFEEALFTALLSAESIDSVVSSNLETLRANRQQLTDLSAGGAVVGAVAFTVGTTYQVIYDIVNTFAQVIKYAGIGMADLYESAKNHSAEEPEDSLIPASDSTVLEVFQSFDLEAFLTTDLPALVAELEAVIQAIMDDFIENAADYGKSVAQHLTTILGGSVATFIEVLLEPYDENASVLDRMLYAVRQWFLLGTMLGPLIVDIVLLFCSGGTTGVVSAATKLSKLEKLADVLAFARRSVEVMESLPVYRNLVQRLSGLTSTVTRLFDALWNAAGPAATQLQYILETLYKVPEPDWPDVETVAYTIDKWYDRCSALNLFVGVLVILSGSGETDSDGNLVAYDAV